MKDSPYIFNSVSELHRTLQLPEPQHPLISLVNYADVPAEDLGVPRSVIMNMYKISLKFNFSGRLKYGQQFYDFESGGLSFFSPLQVISPVEEGADYSGYSLHIHPDFLLNTPLAGNIRNYGFFSYDVNEALCMSEKEKAVVSAIFESIKEEMNHSIDHFSQDIIISQIEQLLNYSNRYYNRQFITRKAVHSNLITRLDNRLDESFAHDEALQLGMLSVGSLAEELQVSTRYLSDMLKSLTGMTTQQYIQNRMIDKAKELLSVGSLSISEIAYTLGFEHPQSFNKIFKRRTNLSPLEFRQSFK